MAEIVNLNRFRKEKARAADRAAADANAARHGRSKAEKTRDRAAADKAARDLDGHARAPRGNDPAREDGTAEDRGD